MENDSGVNAFLNSNSIQARKTVYKLSFLLYIINRGDNMNYTYIILIVIMIAFDVLTGWIKAIKRGKFKSTVMKKGLLSKVTEMIILMLMYVLEYYLPQINVNIGLPIVQLVGVYIIIMELSSVIENIGAVNPELQKKLAHVFADFITKEGDEE